MWPHITSSLTTQGRVRVLPPNLSFVSFFFLLSHVIIVISFTDMYVLSFFELNVGPWNRLDEDEAFVSNVPEQKPPGAAFYPDDMGKNEFDAWIASLSADQQNMATSFYTVIRRNATGSFMDCL